MNSFLAFLEKKDVKISIKRYTVDALSYMTQGLFVTLIAGLILKTLGEKLGFFLNITYINSSGVSVDGIGFLIEAGTYAMAMTGGAIGISVAYGLKAPPLVLFSSIAGGYAGYTMGGPAGAFLCAIIGTEFGKIVYKETKVDILVTPITTILVSVAVALIFGKWIGNIMMSIGILIERATLLHPFPMGIIVSVIMGMILTLPISSAAIAITIGLSGLAAGAATAGCCANMIGFAVISYRVNKVGGLVSQGIGTSMLQMPNIIKKPIIWIPVILTSAITGPISTCIFKMKNIPTGAGMGSAGFVGQFGTFEAMGYNFNTLIAIAIVHFILPIGLSLCFSNIMYKLNLMNVVDLKIQEL